MWMEFWLFMLSGICVAAYPYYGYENYNNVQKRMYIPAEQRHDFTQNIPENPSNTPWQVASASAGLMPNSALSNVQTNPYYLQFLADGTSNNDGSARSKTIAKDNIAQASQPIQYPVTDLADYQNYYGQYELSKNENKNENTFQTRTKVYHPQIKAAKVSQTQINSTRTNKVSKLHERDKEGIMSELNSLQSDVKSFRNAMEGMAESVIVGRDQGYNWQEQLQNNLSKRKRKEIINKWISEAEKTQEKISKQLDKTEKRKRRFEGQMVNFFTNYICGDDC